MCATDQVYKLTHLNEEGNSTMVDVGDKNPTKRFAHARAMIVLPSEVLQIVQNQDIITQKGSVFQTAIIAGIMATKKTSELIPLCHPIGLEDCKIDISFNEAQEIVIDCRTSITAKTGVEMEALTGASIAALTIYGMCKALSQNMVIKDIKLIEKTGGKADFRREGD